jgi:hypothetical protein
MCSDKTEKCAIDVLKGKQVPGTSPKLMGRKMINEKGTKTQVKNWNVVYENSWFCSSKGQFQDAANLLVNTATKRKPQKIHDCSCELTGK